jgi:hypothetical protein
LNEVAGRWEGGSSPRAEPRADKRWERGGASAEEGKPGGRAREELAGPERADPALDLPVITRGVRRDDMMGQ